VSSGRAWIAATVLLALTGLAAGLARATTVRVPDSVPTITQALVGALPGDTVLVAPGTYFERLVLPSGVTLRGEGLPGAATIDASLGGSCVEVPGAGQATRLEGFRLLHGRAGVEPGGALRVLGGALDVADCVFEDGQAGFGGGSAAIGGAWVTFRRCTWSSVSAPYGGGHFQSAGRVTIEDGLFDAPQATLGGGIFATNSALVTVHRATIRGARTTGDGAGARFDACTATLSLVRFEDALAGGRGGAVAVAAGGQVLASYCVFLRNAAAGGGGAFHVSCDAAAPGGTGPALAGADCALLSLIHVDILAGGGAVPAAGAVSGAGVVRIRSSLVAGNASGLACLDSRATLDVTCSDLYANGGADLSGNCAPPLDPSNRSVDPYLCDLAGGDVGRCANSPLAEAGPCDPDWGSSGVRCGPCGPTPVASSTWGRIKARYR
jgi:hypothetical protein